MKKIIFLCFTAFSAISAMGPLDKAYYLESLENIMETNPKAISAQVTSLRSKISNLKKIAGAGSEEQKAKARADLEAANWQLGQLEEALGKMRLNAIAQKIRVQEKKLKDLEGTSRFGEIETAKKRIKALEKERNYELGIEEPTFRREPRRMAPYTK